MIFYELHTNDFFICESEGITFPSHLHKQLELMVCFSGKIRVTCDFRAFTLEADDWMLVLPECEHSYVESEAFRGAILIFNPTLISHLSPYFKRKLLCPVIHSEDSLLQDCVHRLLEHRGRAEGNAVVKGCLYVILGTLLGQCSFLEGSVTGEPVVQKILDYLSEHFTEEITLQSLAEQFGLNHFYLSHLFQDKLGCSFLKYLHTLRIDYAKYLLKNSDRTVTEICYECGFSTQRSFNRVFLQTAGRTPVQYRREIQ